MSFERSPFFLCFVAFALLAGGCAPQQVSAPARGEKVAPPVAQTHPTPVKAPHGTRIDDYYWLRDDTRTSKAVLDYLEAENAYRDKVMAHTQDLQQHIFDEIVARIDPDESSVPEFNRGFWYYTRYVAGLDYPVYARRKGGMNSPEEVLLDGNAMAAGHAYFQIGTSVVSPDGNLLAYAVDTVGRRQYELHVKNLVSGEVLPDSVANVEPNVVWANDNTTLVYIAKNPVTLLSERVHKHRLGTDSTADPLVYEEADRSYYIGLVKSRSEKYLFIELESTEQTEWRYADAGDPELRFEVVLPREANHEYQVEHLGTDFVIRTNANAPNFRVVRTPISSRTDRSTWRDVVAHRSEAFVASYQVATDYLAVNERSGGLAKVRVKRWDDSHERRATARENGDDVLIDAAEPAYTMTIDKTPGIDSATLRYVYTSLITPDSVYDYDMRTGKKELQKQQKVLGGYDAKRYRSEFLEVPARDGKRIPVSLAYRKGTPLDGTAPLYQYGYGSYGASTDPEFVGKWVSLLDRGFVVAIAHVRGGQELGRAWYEDGRLLNKMNTFTDFIDATRYLVTHGYGAPDKAFAAGVSAGGLLMGAVANMAPRDYRGIIAYVPFVDAVTTMLDESIPLTTNEFDEWGNPKENPAYEYMLSYSPYDNVVAQAYPALLVFGALWDSQVQYFEPAKWVAKLRAKKTDANLLVFSVDMAAGHGGKSGRFGPYRNTALEYAFILDQLDAPSALPELVHSTAVSSTEPR